MAESPIVVAGAGVFGVAAAIALRARGFAVAVHDPGPLPRPEAASTDISKVVRMDYGDDVAYTALMEEALPIWRSWNARFREELFHEDGFLLLSLDPFARGRFEGDSFEALRARGHELVRLDREAIAEKFPAWRRGAYVDGYFNPAGGWAESGRVLARMIEDAQAAGVRFRLGERLSPVPGGPTLIAAGAWTPGLLPQLSGVMRPVAQPVFHLRPENPEAWRPPRFPVWAADIARTGWYGFPANRDGLVKIANHGPGRVVDPDAARTTLPEDEAALRAFLRDNLPGLADAPVALSKTCLYCDTFDGDFFIGRDPENPGIVVAAGDSGHAFKFAPVIGDLIADVVQGRPNRHAARFAWRGLGPGKTEAARFVPS